METSAKERLTGALLVVLALVILVPELLSGHRAAPSGTQPAQNPEEGAPLQTYDVRLDGSKDSPAAAGEVPAATAAEIVAVPAPVNETGVEPVAALATKSASPDASPARPPELSATGTDGRQPATKPSRAVPESAATPAPAGKWWVQLGVFASRDNAQQLERKLRAAGFTVEVAQGRSKGKELYRVRAGPVADRAAASALQARLAAAGQENPSLVPP